MLEHLDRSSHDVDRNGVENLRPCSLQCLPSHFLLLSVNHILWNCMKHAFYLSTWAAIRTGCFVVLQSLGAIPWTSRFLETHPTNPKGWSKFVDLEVFRVCFGYGVPECIWYSGIQY